jgi:hypothetical protein
MRFNSAVPAKAGTHPSAFGVVDEWVPAFAGTRFFFVKSISSSLVS